MIEYLNNATENPINDDDKCFQSAATVAIDHEEIGANSQRIPKIKLFINKYNWKGINYPSGKNGWKKFEKNNPTIILNVRHVRKMNIYPAYILKNNLNHKKQIILLMTPNHYMILMMALSCSKKIICIINRNNVKTCW